MNRTNRLLMIVCASLAVVAASGCTSSSPIKLAVHLAGAAANDVDVRDKAAQLDRATAEQCDETLGQPLEVYQNQDRSRQWRIYPVKYDVMGSHRYVVELADGHVIGVSKAQRNKDMAIDAVTYVYFRDRCAGNTPEVCQEKNGRAPELTVRSVKTGQPVQIYDARLVSQIQKPYYAVLRFGPDGTCSDISIFAIVASSTDGPL